MTENDFLDELRVLYETEDYDKLDCIEKNIPIPPHLSGKTHEHKQAIPVGLIYCIANNVPIPPWLANAFLEACRKVSGREVGSWDDVFGKPVLKGQRLYNLWRDLQIVERVKNLHAAGGSLTRDGIFTEVGEEKSINLSASTVERIWCDRVRTFGDEKDSEND
jgi:hypothetical protein